MEVEGERPFVATADLCDKFGDRVQYVDSVVNNMRFLSFGSLTQFQGPVYTVRAYEGNIVDNSHVRPFE